MCNVESFRLRILRAVCYLCGHDDFTVEDMEAAQKDKNTGDNSRIILPHAICPSCGYTIEI